MIKIEFLTGEYELKHGSRPAGEHQWKFRLVDAHYKSRLEELLTLPAMHWTVAKKRAMHVLQKRLLEAFPDSMKIIARVNVER